MIESKQVLRDWYGDYLWLSPSATGKTLPHPVRIESEGIVYSSLTNALQALKTTDKDERKIVAKMAPYTAIEWGRSKPAFLEPWYQEYHRQKIKLAMPLIRQRFGGQPSEIDFGYKLELGFNLLQTGDKELIWVNHECEMYWGACACVKHNSIRNSNKTEGAVGRNVLGQIMMLVRKDLFKRFEGDLEGSLCSFCFDQRGGGKVTQGEVAIIYWSDNGLRRYIACKKHRSTVAKHAKRHARRRKVYHVPVTKKKEQAHPHYDPWEDGAEDWEEWRAYERAWAQGAVVTTYTPIKDNWNVIIFDPSSPKKMVESVLESV